MSELLASDDVSYMEAMYRLHEAAVRNVCLGRMRDPSIADDIVQEVFHRAAQHIARLRIDPLPWLLTVAVNLCTSEHRRRARESGDLELASAQSAERRALDPEEEVVSRIIVHELMSCLTEAERRVVTEKCLNDRTHVEAGRALGLSSGTTRQLMLRARRRIRAYARKRNVLPGLGVILVAAQARWRRLTERLRGRPGSFAELSGTTLTMSLIAAATLATVLAPQPSGLPVGGHRALGAETPVASLPTPVSGPLAIAPGRGAGPQSAPAAHRAAAPSRQGDLVGGTIDEHVHYTNVKVSDMQAVPNPPSGAILMALGGDTACNTVACMTVERSLDGGATWQVPPQVDQHPAWAQLNDAHILLTQWTPRFGQFYLWGQAAPLLRLESWGAAPPVPEPSPPAYLFASVAKLPTTDLLVASGNALWFENLNQPPAPFAPGYQAAGPATYLASADVLLQPVSQAPPLGSGEVSVVRCSVEPIGCQPPSPTATLPLTGEVQLLVPSLPAGEVVAWAAGGVERSDDGGTTFQPGAPVEGSEKLLGAVLVDHDGGQRLVVIYRQVAGAAGVDRVAYSDDLGATWVAGIVAAPPRADLGPIAVLGPDRLIVAAQLDPTDARDARDAFFCSDDGGVRWRDCAG